MCVFRRGYCHRIEQRSFPVNLDRLARPQITGERAEPDRREPEECDDSPGAPDPMAALNYDRAGRQVERALAARREEQEHGIHRPDVEHERDPTHDRGPESDTLPRLARYERPERALAHGLAEQGLEDREIEDH